MKKFRIPIILLVVVLLISGGIFLWKLRNSDIDSSKQAEELSTTQQCPFSVSVPNGYELVDASTPCSNTYVGKSDDASVPSLFVEQVSATQIPKLSEWVAALLKNDEITKFREKPTEGAVIGSVEVRSKGTHYASVDTYLNTEKGTYVVSMYAREPEKSFTDAEMTVYRDLVKSFAVQKLQ